MRAVDEPRQHDRAARVVDVGRQPHLLEGGFEARDVAGADVDDRVGAARHGSRIHHFRHRREDAQQLVGRDRAAAEQLDVGFGAHPVDRRVDLDREAADHPVGDEPVDASLDGRGREPHDRSDVAVAGARVLAEQVEDAAIEVVHGQILWSIVARRPPFAANCCVGRSAASDDLAPIVHVVSPATQ